MDEEDLQELRESRTLVDTVEEMDISGGTAAELKRRRNEDDTEQEYVALVGIAFSYSFVIHKISSIVNALQSTLLPPAADSAGARILRKMGWRVGSGVGPRVSLKQRRLQDLQTSSPYGTRAVIDDIKLTEDDEEASKHTYAPRDTPVLIIERKDNFHGLGYRSGMTLNESLGSSKADSGKGPRISGKFISNVTSSYYSFFLVSWIWPWRVKWCWWGWPRRVRCWYQESAESFGLWRQTRRYACARQ